MRWMWIFPEKSQQRWMGRYPLQTSGLITPIPRERASATQLD
jgi:hypothetical protein